MEAVQQISQKEAHLIDANTVDYYTLKDGTIIKIKREGEEDIGAQIQGQKQNINQNSSEEFQGQSQYQKNVQNQNQFLNRNVNTNNIYIMSNEGGNYPQSHQNFASNYNQIPQSYVNYNAKLINAQAFNNQILNQLELKNLSLSGPQIVQYGPKRQLYKLVEAIPVRINETNSQQNSQQFKANTYVIKNAQYQNLRQRMDMNNNEQLNQNKTFKINVGKNFSFNQNLMNSNQYEGEEYQNVNEQYNNNTQCTCHSGHL